MNLSNQENKKDINKKEREIEIKPIKEKKKNIHGRLFVAIAILVLIIEFYLFIFHTIKPLSFKGILIDLIYIGLYIMIFWSYYTVMYVPPGMIPLYWGFYIGDEEQKRKRYCLICNSFKPERSKHCSICNVCILNMDHHCPWVNNCIGFYNRKYFMQFIIYLELTYIYSWFFSFLYLIKNFKNLNTTGPALIEIVILCLNYIGLSIFIFMFGRFVFYHISLVINNSSTIEDLDKENKYKYKKYSLSIKENIEQVFGSNKLYWMVPIVSEKSKPVGDGLLWKTNLDDAF